MGSRKDNYLPGLSEGFTDFHWEGSRIHFIVVATRL